MPSKPAKYEIKIFWLCDSFTPFATDGIIYLGKQPGEAKQKNLGENVVVVVVGLPLLFLGMEVRHEQQSRFTPST